MFYVIYICFMLFLLGFGVLAVAYGLKGLLWSKAESYNEDSLMLNLWGSVVVLVIGIVMTALGISWVLGFR